MLDEMGDGADNKPIKEVDNVQIGEVVVDRVRFKDVKIALVTLKQFFGTKPYWCCTSHLEQSNTSSGIKGRFTQGVKAVLKPNP